MTETGSPPGGTRYGFLVSLLFFMAALFIQAAHNPEGRELYNRACAACHGLDGRGVARSTVGFDIPLPDFSDCDFANREPDGDWVAVAHQGGPLRGFSEIMPAFGEILSIDELRHIIGYIRSFCLDKSWPRGGLNFPRPLVTEKAYPEDEAVWEFATDDSFSILSAQFVYEQRFGSRNQFEFTLPVGWIQRDANGDEGSSDGRESVLGDIAVGVKRVLSHSIDRGSILSVTAEMILPTGNAEQGFGKDTFVFEPFITFGQSLGADFFLHSQLGMELPFRSDRAESEAFLRLALGRSFTSGRWGRTWSPMIEVLGHRGFEAGSPVIWDLVPQLQVTLNQRQHIMCNLGVCIPMTETGERDIRILLYLLWDWFDGGFFEGW